MTIRVDAAPGRGSLDTEIGIISDLRVKHVVENVFWREGSRAGMAATGAVAAAFGLSGAAAGMAMMSSEEMKEPVTKVEFMLGELQVEALLWNWPFNEGDRVRVVGSRDNDGGLFALSVLDEQERLIVSYPYVSSGSWAHWVSVMKYTLMISVPTSSIFTLLVGLGSIDIMKDGWLHLKLLLCILGGCLLVSCFVGVRIGCKFYPYAKLADSIFEALGWSDGKYLNLRRITKLNKKEGDHAALGDTYFRY